MDETFTLDAALKKELKEFSENIYNNEISIDNNK